MRTRRLLDLYCGEGLAAWGYWLSGRFSEIVGVDINKNMRRSYAFDFICADALALTYEFLLQFDFIHASPPCQAYSYLTPATHHHPRLINQTRHMLFATGLPHVVENVQGGMKELKPNLTLDGHFVGLPMERRRYFYVSTLDNSKQLIADGEESIRPHGSQFVPRHELVRGFGLDVLPRRRADALTRTGIEQGIPPAMTHYISELVFTDKIVLF